MPVMGRLVLFIYNLIILALAGAVIAVSLGWSDPLTYLNAAASTPESRLVLGAVGIILATIALIMLAWGLKPSKRADTVVVDKGMAGEVSVSIAAIKAIIMKAIRQVEGIKELRPEVSNSSAGVIVKLHTMINPEHNVPEIAQSLQNVVRENLEKVGGLQVAEIKVLVDDFNTTSK